MFKENAMRKMRDSGIAWIGEIPEGWEVSRVGHHYKIILGKMLCSQKLSDNYTQGDITRVTVNDVEIVNRLNEIAFKQQIGRKSGFVFAHSKALLEQLKNKYAM